MGMKDLPPRQTSNVDGHTLAFSVGGSGHPAIVLINGAGGSLAAWYKLYPDIMRMGTVVSYERPGVGKSSLPLEPQTAQVVVRMLRRLLCEIGVPPPYVLVAHSFGGLHANLFARLYPEDIGGVVFLEATAPEDVNSMKAYETRAQRAIKGAFRFFGGFSTRNPNEELEHEAESVAQLLVAPPFPNVPLCVISGGKTLPTWIMTPTALQLRNEHQERLASLSPLGRRVIADLSGHFPQMTEPRLVLEAIAHVCKSADIQHIPLVSTAEGRRG